MEEQELSVFKKRDQSGVQSPRSEDARRQSFSRARKVVAKSTRKYAETVADLVQKALPRKKKSLREAGVLTRNSNLMDTILFTHYQ